MFPDDDAHAQVVERHEQPFLYTWNRRLRHLHGISIRNLNITPPLGRTRGKTLTDDDYNLKTTAKLLAQDERNTLHHARSFDNILKAGEIGSRGPQKSATVNEKDGSIRKRPGGRAMRRRSTLHWASSDPRTRQFKLEAVEANRLVDTFFSIHHDELKEPIYVSEVMEKSMNPSFSFFDLDTTVAEICRSDEFDLKLWAKTTRTTDYRLLLDLRVNLRSLQFIGKSLENFRHPLPENCVLIHLSDGIYTSFTDLPSEDSSRPGLTAAMKSMQEAPTSTFDTLMQLANLDDCIQDALQMRRKLEAEISALLEKTSTETISSSAISTRREVVKATRTAVEAERKTIESIKTAKTELRNSHRARRELIQKSLLPQDTEKPSESIQDLQKEIDNCAENSLGQIRRISAGLLHIFPIEPIKQKTLQFTIRNIHLPNSVFDDTNRDEISAGLGFTAQLVHQLSLYLSVPLPYPIVANGSNSFIHDDISAALTQRQFPLHPTTVNYKFEYGVFLLNKDIEFLMNRSGLRVLDVRHTLPNLKYLLYMLTSGTGDLPARKAGGIRGLLGGRLTPSVSRRGSEDSVHSQSEGMGHAGITARNGVSASLTREKALGVDESLLGPTRAKGLPYRKSMLRDAG